MPFRDKVRALFSSRRFWAAVGGLHVVVVSGLGLMPADTAQQLVTVIGAWILGDSLKHTE